MVLLWSPDVDITYIQFLSRLLRLGGGRWRVVDLIQVGPVR
jgi:hypothetical protein